MATLIQLLMEALRINIGDRNNDSEEEQMTGFILENVQVATIPFIESDGETEEPYNPLLELVHKEESPRKYNCRKGTNKLLDHIVRLEKKVHNLEQCLGPSEFQQRLWLAPTVYKDHSDDDSDAGSANQKKNYFGSRASKSSRHASPNSKKKAESQPIRLEKVDQNCFARLLFSRCWMGKERSAGWKIQRKCPTQTGSLSCPCGMIGPCRKLKANPVPIDRLISSNTKKSKLSPSACSVKGDGCKKPNNSGTQTAKGAHSHKPNEKPLFEKLFPCCFKEHAEGDCCCRCKGKSTIQSNVEKGLNEKSTKKRVPKRKSSSLSVNKSVKSTGHKRDDRNSDEEIVSKKSDVQSFNVQSEDICMSPYKSSRYLSVRSKHHRNGKGGKRRCKKMVDYYKHEPESVEESVEFKLHPDLSENQVLQPEVVSHQILKTLPTIHGPMKVEQNIAVHGAKNSVIVTHGETCQCCLCRMLKSQLHPDVVAEGTSPHVVEKSLGNGPNTCINHSDGCKCGLCRVLDSIVTNNADQFVENETFDMIPGSSSYESNETSSLERAKQGSVTLSVTEGDNTRNKAMKTLFMTKNAKHSAKNGKTKVKKCKCSKCSHRKNVEKLKLKLKKGIGEYDRILSEITQTEENKTTCANSQMLVPNEAIDGGYTDPRRNKKRVSFPDERDTNEGDTRIGNRDCKLCEVIGVRAGPEKEMDAYAMAIEQKCFPPMGLAKKPSRTNTRTEDIIMEDVSLINHVRSGSHSSERFKLGSLRDDDNIQKGEHSPILFMDGEHTFVYLSPMIRPHVAAAYSSESYYAPDQDEFPIVNGASDESSRS